MTSAAYVLIHGAGEASVGVTDDGRMKLHVESKGDRRAHDRFLLDLFGLDYALMTLTKRGVTVSEDDIRFGKVTMPDAAPRWTRGVDVVRRVDL